MFFRCPWTVRAFGYLPLFFPPAIAAGEPSFVAQPVALSHSTGSYGPQLGPVTTFTGYNGPPSIGATGEVAYPGDLSPAFNGSGEGFWLHRDGQNSAIALTNTDGPLGPGLGPGMVFGNTFHDALNGAPGEVLIGGFPAGPGVDNSNNLLYVRHHANVNSPVARNGVDNLLGPGLGANIIFSSLGGAQINSTSDILLSAAIAGPGVTAANSEGFWHSTPAGNVMRVRAGVNGPLGPGLGDDVVFDHIAGTSAFQQYQLLENSGDFMFVGQSADTLTLQKSIGLWKNTVGGNLPMALSGVTGPLGPGLGPALQFGGPDQSPFGYLRFDANSQGTTAFFSTLADNRRGLWRNLGQQNEPLMLEGESGALGPGTGINDTFANFAPGELLADPAINEDDVVLFPGLLTNSKQQGLWLNSGSENRVIALTGDDGELGPGLGAGITFTGFNRAYFGGDDTVYFTADLSYSVPFNRLLGLWAYRNGSIEPIVVYNELFDVDPTAGVDARRVEWVQIPSDFTYNNDYGANDLNQLVFTVGFQDGSQGIFVTRPIPEPGAGLLVSTAALATVSLRRRAPVN